jgi:hypothetical protein
MLEAWEEASGYFWLMSANSRQDCSQLMTDLFLNLGL